LILFQLYKIEREEVKKPSQVDRIFKQALREFKENLLATYSVANKQGNGQLLNIKYKDLIANFLHVKYLLCKICSVYKFMLNNCLGNRDCVWE